MHKFDSLFFCIWKYLKVQEEKKYITSNFSDILSRIKVVNIFILTKDKTTAACTRITN